MSNTKQAIDNIMNMIDQVKLFGEDALLAYNTYKELKNTGSRLVNKYGKGVGAGEGIDNYYHPLLFCKLAQKGENSRRNGRVLGLAKEVFDIYNKTDISKKDAGKKLILNLLDSAKDLTNNAYGDIMGKENPDIDCRALLDHLRTENMRNEGIK